LKERTLDIKIRKMMQWEEHEVGQSLGRGDCHMEKKTRTRLWRVMLVLFVITAVGPCTITHKFGPYYGIVLDQETGQPIEGACINVSFYTKMLTPGGDVSKYVNAMETLTDRNGEFYIESYRAFLYRVPQVWDKHCDVRVFKPGYGAYPNNMAIKNRYEPSYSLPPSQYLIIKLPKLKTWEERYQNLGFLIPVAVPDDKMIELKKLEETEIRNLGFRGY
jgi:hypothetical protein